MRFIKHNLAVLFFLFNLICFAQREEKIDFGLFVENQFMLLNGKATEFPVNSLYDSGSYFNPDLVHTVWKIKQYFNVGLSQTHYYKNGAFLRTKIYAGLSRLQIDANVDYVTYNTFADYSNSLSIWGQTASIEDYNSIISTLPSTKKIQLLSVPKVHIGGEWNYGRIFNSYKTIRPFFSVNAGFVYHTYRNFKLVQNEVPELLISKEQLNPEYTATVFRGELGLTIGTEIKGLKLYTSFYKGTSFVVYPNEKYMAEDNQGSTVMVGDQTPNLSKPFKGASYFKIGIEKRFGLKPKKDEPPILNAIVAPEAAEMRVRNFRYYKIGLRSALSLNNTGLDHNLEILSLNYFTEGATDKLRMDRLASSNYFEGNIVNPLLFGVNGLFRYKKVILRAGLDYHPLRLDQTFDFQPYQFHKDASGNFIIDTSYSSLSVNTNEVLSKDYLHIPAYLQLGLKVSNLKGRGELFLFGGIGFNWLLGRSSFYTNNGSKISSLAKEFSNFMDGNYQSTNDSVQYYINFSDFDTPVYTFEGSDYTPQPYLNQLPTSFETFTNSRYNRLDNQPSYRTWYAGVLFSQRRWTYLFNIESKIRKNSNSMIYFWSMTLGVEYSLFVN